MKKSNLQKILDDWNKSSMQNLEEQLGIKARDIYDDFGTRVYHGMPVKRHCQCGPFTGENRFPKEIIDNSSGLSVAVGAIIDDDSSTAAEDLPVVVVVGINYTQLGQINLTNNVWKANWKKTLVRDKLKAVLKRIDQPCLKGEIANNVSQYHVAVTNFFPWLTVNSWGSLSINRIGEALALRCWGYENPVKRIAELITLIYKGFPQSNPCVSKIPFVVFHSASNAVPLLGLETIRNYSAEIRTNTVRLPRFSGHRTFA